MQKALLLFFHFFSRKLRTSASEGRAGIAPFFVVVIAPQAFANLSTFRNLSSSCEQTPIMKLEPVYSLKPKEDSFNGIAGCLPREWSDHRQSCLGGHLQRNLQLRLYPQRSHGKGQRIHGSSTQFPNPFLVRGHKKSLT